MNDNELSERLRLFGPAQEVDGYELCVLRRTFAWARRARANSTLLPFAMTVTSSRSLLSTAGVRRWRSGRGR
jgi:hypothetical protein